MRTKLIVALVALIVLALGGGAWAYTASKAKTSCCYPGSECCFPGSPCCDDCCDPDSGCCCPGSPCCSAAEKTEADCRDGSSCPDGPCCTAVKAKSCCED